MIFKKLIEAMLCCALPLFAINAFAQDANAAYMHVQISNESGATCQLTNQILSHGVFESSPPRSIMANDSKFFDMEQAFYGPDITLSYNCGTALDGSERSVTFEVQQDASWFMGHMPIVTIQSVKGLQIESNTLSGSAFYNNNGIANIIISSAS